MRIWAIALLLTQAKTDSAGCIAKGAGIEIEEGQLNTAVSVYFYGLLNCNFQHVATRALIAKPRLFEPAVAP